MELRDLTQLQKDKYKNIAARFIHELIDLADEIEIDRNELLSFTVSHLSEITDMGDFSNYDLEV